MNFYHHKTAYVKNSETFFRENHTTGWVGNGGDDILHYYHKLALQKQGAKNMVNSFVI